MFRTISKMGGFALSMLATLEVAHAEGPTPTCYPCSPLYYGGHGDDPNQACASAFGFDYYYCANDSSDPSVIYCCPA